MLSKKAADLLNVQVNKELYSAYLHLHFSNFYSEQGLDGFASWYMVQAGEERDHAMQFLDRFVKEQNEEEVNAAELVKKMELFGSDARGLYMLNSELGARKQRRAAVVTPYTTGR